MERNALPAIYFAPLQESTDFIYRRAHANHFGGIDKYFSPYLLIQKDGGMKKSHMRDTSSENCEGYTLVPQIMAGNGADFLFLAKHLTAQGYEEINWNLGCPYPMVTGKGMGSGLLPQPAKIREILETAMPQLGCKLSVKLRLGLVSSEEIMQVIPVLNDFPLSEVIIHPRIARQLYSGMPDWELFAQAEGLLKHKLVYNGDLVAKDDLQSAQEQFKSVDTWMIGRGMLMNPFLAAEIKGEQLPGKGEKIAKLERFHEEIFGSYSAMLSGQSHLIMRMIKFWEYFCFLFPNPHKSFKRVKKSVSLAKYEIAVTENFMLMRNED